MGGIHREPMTRRTLLARMAALSAAAWASPLWVPDAARLWAQTADTVAHPEGTTIERTITTVGGGPYFRLGFGPGWPVVARGDLAEAKPGREGRREPIVAFLHVTDFQLVDAQSPARVEFFDRYADEPSPAPIGAAQRPQEPFIAHVVEALVRQFRSVGRAPVTGADVAFTISTGDNLDNAQLNEMRWFATLMNGGTFAPNSGAADAFEGVMGFDDPVYYDDHYWHPEDVAGPVSPDRYKSVHGFPSYPGLLAAAIQDFDAVGLPHRWYSVYGNHDYLVQGNVQRNDLFDQIAMGPSKVLAPPPGMSYSDLLNGLEAQDPVVAAQFSSSPARPVTPDEERHLMHPSEYIRAHLDAAGPFGPAGHGFTEDNLEGPTFHYTFDVAEGVRGIVLDTTSPATSEGSIGQAQLAWLEQRLVEVHSRYHEAGGTEATTDNTDQLVVLFSHHRPSSMEPIQGPGSDGSIEQRFGGDELLELLHRFPNVVLWVNGHSHFNRIVAHPDPAGRTGGFWDLTTSAQIDPPQQARILELVDNRDGTLSIFTTLIDHAGGPDTAVGAYDLLGVAGIAREVAYNDPQAGLANKIGEPTDLNTELLVTAPFDLRGTGRADAGRRSRGEPARQQGGPALPATGAGLGVAAAATALAGTVAWRERGRRSD